MIDPVSLSETDLSTLFSSIQHDFLAAVVEGDSAALEFATAFSSLHAQTVRLSASKNASTDCAMLEVAHKASVGVAALASGLLELEMEADNISTALESEISDIFSGLSLEGPSSQSKCSTETASVKETSPFQCSSKWLLDNIHNPYPRLETKKRLAKELGISTKGLSEWFSQMRRRIGWTSIAKRHFKGSRQLTVDCACRIFIENTGFMTYSNNVVQDMINMRKCAEDLLNKNTTQSQLAEKLGETPVGSLERTEQIQQRNSCFSHMTTGCSPVYRGEVSGQKRRRRSTFDCVDSGNESLNTVASSEQAHLIKKRRIVGSSKERPASRSASSSTSLSSRSSSSSELLTPTPSLSDLPVICNEKSIDDWLSELPDELYDTVHSATFLLQEARSHRSSEFEAIGFSNGSVSEECNNTLSASAFECFPPFTHDVQEDIFEILSGLDFTLPPPVSLDNTLFEEDPLQANEWKGIESEKSWDLHSSRGVAPFPCKSSVSTRKRRLSGSISFEGSKRCRTSGSSQIPSSSESPLRPLSSICDANFTSSTSFTDKIPSIDLQSNAMDCPDWNRPELGFLSSQQSGSCELSRTICQSNDLKEEVTHAIIGDNAQCGSALPTTQYAFQVPVMHAALNSDLGDSSITQLDGKLGEQQTLEISDVRTSAPTVDRESKLERINLLLSEAAKLQQEVFG